MEKIIYFDYDNGEGDRELECIVEYVEYVDFDDPPYDSGNLVREVINVFLPEGLDNLSEKERAELRVRACEEFHNLY